MSKSSRLITAVSAAILTPYLARVPGIASHGVDWLLSYFPSVFGVVFFAAFAAIPGVALFVLSCVFRKQTLAFRLGLLAMIIALIAMHATLDLASDSTAAVALVIFPFLAGGPMIVGFFVGVLLNWLFVKRRQP